MTDQFVILEQNCSRTEMLAGDVAWLLKNIGNDLSKISDGSLRKENKTF